jgi:hypothetical protein
MPSSSSRSPGSASRESRTSASGGATSPPPRASSSGRSETGRCLGCGAQGPLRRRRLEPRGEHPPVPPGSDRTRDDLLRRAVSGTGVAGPVAGCALDLDPRRLALRWTGGGQTGSAAPVRALREQLLRRLTLAPRPGRDGSAPRGALQLVGSGIRRPGPTSPLERFQRPGFGPRARSPASSATSSAQSPPIRTCGATATAPHGTAGVCTPGMSAHPQDGRPPRRLRGASGCETGTSSPNRLRRRRSLDGWLGSAG